MRNAHSISTSYGRIWVCACLCVASSMAGWLADRGGQSSLMMAAAAAVLSFFFCCCLIYKKKKKKTHTHTFVFSALSIYTQWYCIINIMRPVIVACFCVCRQMKSRSLHFSFCYCCCCVFYYCRFSKNNSHCFVRGHPKSYS